MDKDYCEHCSKELEFDTVDLSFGYGSKFDTQGFLFCSDECLFKWIKDKSNELSSKNEEKGQ